MIVKIVFLKFTMWTYEHWWKGM